METLTGNLYKHRLPEEQLRWLQERLQAVESPVVVFSHCALDDQDVRGNYFYEGYDAKNKRGFFLENQQEIQRILSASQKVEMVIQAHLHYFHTKVIASLPYVTCPAMGDNICAPNIDTPIPEIYSLLTIDKAQIVLKSFSREYCFAGAEFTRAR